MKIRILIATLVVVSLAFVAVPAAAEVEISVPTDGGGTENVSAEVVDEDTAILSSTYHDDRGVLTMMIFSNTGQRITVTDGAALTTGSGEIDRKTVRLQHGRNRVTIPVTEASGRVAAVIDTGDVLYGHVKRIGDPLITGPWTQQDVQIAGLSAGIGVAIVAVVLVLREMIGGRSEPEVLA